MKHTVLENVLTKQWCNHCSCE